jgi:hypothetical protein
MPSNSQEQITSYEKQRIKFSSKKLCNVDIKIKINSDLDLKLFISNH